MKVVRTLCQDVKVSPGISEWFDETQRLYNVLACIYVLALDQHLELVGLPSRAAADALERLSHSTQRNSYPSMHSKLADDVPFHFRRAAMMAAIGLYRSFRSNLAAWRKRKEKAAAAGKRFEERPPKLPGELNMSPVFYKRMYRNYDGKSIVLKLYDGETAWRWVKVELSGRPVPDGWKVASPRLVKRRRRRWELHFAITKEVAKPTPIDEQLQDEETRICAWDLNFSHLAVGVILKTSGEVLATKFIGGGKDLSHRRRRQLGRIYRRMGETGVVGKDEQHCRGRWDRVRNINRNEAHRISRRIVDFALQHGASIIVFEDLKNFRPRKTDVNGHGRRRSSEANLRRSYWMRGQIQTYAAYKARQYGIVVKHVSPWNTSRECSNCGEPVIRYNGAEPEDGYVEGAPLVYCPACGRRDHADRNAAINIGLKFLKQHRKPDWKP